MADILTTPTQRHLRKPVSTPSLLVAKHLRMWARTPFDWHTENCGLSVVRYLEDLYGLEYPEKPDIADHRAYFLYVRNTKLLTDHFAHCAWFFNMHETDEPPLGSIGLVSRADGKELQLVAGIKTYTGWACRMRDGTIIDQYKAHKAWGI